MAVTTTNTNKPINPRGDDKSPLAFNRAKIYSGKALDFDGVNDVVNVTTNELDFGANDFSVSAIVDWSGSIVDGKLAYLDKGGSLAAWQIRTNDSFNRLVFQAHTSSGWSEVNFDYAALEIQNDLTHLTFVRVGSSVTLYINGALYGRGSGLAETLDASNGEFAIGNRIGAENYWSGKIGQYKIFSSALTAAQVLDLYNNPEKTVPTGVADSALKLWLPMMEGAGTTAYDGSGNGNHVTISGATWTHGIGAPVAQTAVINWNKGTNLLLQSNQFDTTWTTSNLTPTGGETGYDGSSDAWLLDISGGASSQRIEQSMSFEGIQTFSVYAKAGTLNWIRMRGSSNTYFDLNPSTTGSRIGTDGHIDSKIESMGNGWFRCSVVTETSSLARIYVATDNGNVTQSSGSIYIQDAQLESASTAGPYVLTLSTAQSNEVLIPQSLTSGRDLFYNSFENARKKYALNLDGKSWVEVHDNASLDFGAGSFSLEAWAKLKYVSQGSSINVIMTLGNEVVSTNSAGLSVANSDTAQIWYKGNSSASSPLTEGDWIHIVGVYDETKARLYVNGLQVDQDTRTAASITNTLVKQIGRDITTIRYYNDQIAQPRIYNRALTAEEVEQNYNAGKNTYS